jgi:hypothetical protein
MTFGWVKYVFLGHKIDECTWNIRRISNPCYVADRRKSTFSFRCRLDGNNGEADDRITAIPDGALVLITNKKSDPDSEVIWSLQGAALAFEVP